MYMYMYVCTSYTCIMVTTLPFKLKQAEQIMKKIEKEEVCTCIWCICNLHFYIHVHVRTCTCRRMFHMMSPTESSTICALLISLSGKYNIPFFWHRLAIFFPLIRTLYCAKGNYEFGISRIMKSLEPYNKKVYTCMCPCHGRIGNCTLSIKSGVL